MSIQDLLVAIKVGEDVDWEFKSAKGGLPKSLWESYVAMANTDGGNIVLGVEDDGFVSGLGDAAKMQTNFWNTVNNRGHVSVNLLTDQSVRIETIDSKDVLVIAVPRADRRQRPVFLSQNPLTGTYRRNFEGDYHCSEEEVRRMLADQSDAPADSLILQGFTFDDLDSDSLQQYRNRFSAARPQHPWLELGEQDLLSKLGGWRKDRESDDEGLTVAGLLMFGKDEAIRDPAAIPQYHLDYREILADEADVRWSDRITIDGTWIGNLYQFYHRAIQKLTADLKIPFKLEPDLFRKDDTIVHEAVREALVNALIHADFRGQGGIVIEKHVNQFTLSNPGTLLLSFDQLLKGGVSECRNKSLQKMFLMIGGGEQAGSGIDKIRKGWNSQHWRLPRIQERAKPDRVTLVLPMVSLLPEESVARLQECFGAKFEALNDLERMAVITADVEGEVSNARMREICSEHPSDITSMFQRLVGKKMLKQYGHKRGTSYKLDLPTPTIDDGNSTHNGADSTHNGADSAHSSKTLHIDTSETGFSEAIRAIAKPSTDSQRLAKPKMKALIVEVCKHQFFTGSELGNLLNRQPTSLQQSYLREMVGDGDLVLRFPGEPNHPKQAYGHPSLVSDQQSADSNQQDGGQA